MDVSNSTAASAVKTLLSDKHSDRPATGTGFGQVMSDVLTKAAATGPISDPMSPNASVDTRKTVADPADISKSGTGRMTIADSSPFDRKPDIRTTIGQPADISKAGTGRMTIADTSPFDLKTETRTTIGHPADLPKADHGRMTIADTSVFDKKAPSTLAQDSANALERSLSLLLADQLEAATSHFNGFEALRASDS